MEFGTIQIAVIIGIVLTVVLGAIVNMLCHKRQRFIKACDDFCAAFAPELAALKNPSSDHPIDPYETLKSAFEKHRTAVSVFRQFLRKGERRRFDKAWENYCAYDDTGKHSTEFLLKYSPGWVQQPISECRHNAIANIEALLAFTK